MITQLSTSRPARPPITIQPDQLFIRGQWQSASDGQTFDTLNPATERVITQLAQGKPHDAQQAIKAARDAYDASP